MKQPLQPVPPDPSADDPAPAARDEVEHRQIVYRVLFDRPSAWPQSPALVASSGTRCSTSRHGSMISCACAVRNHDIAHMCGAKSPAPTFFTLGKAFMQLRWATPWLQATPYAPVRYTLSSNRYKWRH